MELKMKCNLIRFIFILHTHEEIIFFLNHIIFLYIFLAYFFYYSAALERKILIYDLKCNLIVISIFIYYVNY